jgi:ketosteroid isomerase-like protein
MTNATESALLQALQITDDRLEEANRAADVPALERLIADDFVYTGGQGGHISRGEWIAAQLMRRLTPDGEAQAAKTRERAAQAGRGTVLLLTGLRVGEPDEYETELHGDVAIVNRRYSIQDADGSERCLRCVRVYRQQGNEWRLISHRYIHAVD